MNLTAIYLISILTSNGFYLKRTKGSHHLFYNPNTNKTAIVPMHKGKDLPKGTFFSILRQAGISQKQS